MGGVGVQHVVWDEDFFEKAFTQAWQCIQAVTAHQKPLARFRAIADSLSANEQIPRGIEPKKYGETRYGSRVTQCVYHMRLWITVSIVTDNIVYVVSFWWRGEG